MGHRSVARLTAFDAAGAQVIEEVLPLADDYEHLHPLLDRNDFRVGRGIVRLIGRLYDSAGGLVQEFENHYSEDGAYLPGTARRSEGTRASE